MTRLTRNFINCAVNLKFLKIMIEILCQKTNGDNNYNKNLQTKLFMKTEIRVLHLKAHNIIIRNEIYLKIYFLGFPLPWCFTAKHTARE